MTNDTAGVEGAVAYGKQGALSSRLRNAKPVSIELPHGRNGENTSLGAADLENTAVKLFAVPTDDGRVAVKANASATIGANGRVSIPAVAGRGVTAEPGNATAQTAT